MSIADELRTGGIYRFPSNMRVFTEEELTAIADRIDAEHFKALQERSRIGTMAVISDPEQYGLVELPKDVDGEVIHVGDKLHDGWHELNRGEVEWLMLDRHGWWLMFKSDCERFYVHEFHEWRHHHKQPTVEDLLRELVDEWVMADSTEDEEAVIAECAKKLRLAGDAE